MPDNGSSFRIAPSFSTTVVRPPVLLHQDFDVSVVGPRTVPAVVFDSSIESNPDYILEPGIIDPGIIDQSAYAVTPQFDGTVDISVVQTILPRGAERQQIIGRPVIEVDGVEISPRELTGVFQLTERVDGARTFSFQMPARSQGDYDTGTSYGNHFGEDWLGSWLGAPLGKQSLDVYWIVPGATDYYKIPVVTDGIVENAELVQSDEGELWQINCVGREQRLDRQKVSLLIPPGHGLGLGHLLKKILGALDGLQGYDVPFFRTGGSPCHPVIEAHRYKEIVLKDDSGWQVANEIAGLFGYRMQVNREGDLEVVYTGLDKSAEYDWTLTPVDVLANPGIVFTPNNDGPTAVRITGESQVVHDDGDGAGLSTEILETLIEQTYTRIKPQQKISDVAGTLVSTGFSESTNFQRVGKTRVTRTNLFGSPVSEKVETWGWYNPEAVAGDLQNDGTTDWRIGTYIDEPRAVEWSEEKWVKLATESRIWNYEDYYDEDLDITIKYLRENREWRYGWYAERGAVANITSAGAFDWINGQDISWAGEGFEDSEEEYREVGQTAHWIWGENLFKDRARIFEYFWGIRPGNNYYYARGDTGANSSEDYKVQELIEIDYVERGTENHDEIVNTRAYHNKKPAMQIITKTGQPGYLPAVPIIDGAKPNEDDYPDGKIASREETQGFEVLYRSEELEQFRQAYEETFSSHYIETEDEATCVARQIVREGATVPVTWHMALNPMMKPSHKVSLDAGEYAGEKKGQYDVVTEEVRQIFDWNSMRGHTEVDGKVYTV